MTGWWTQHVVPRIADRALDDPVIQQWRTRVCAGLRGRVVEIGFGSGLNIGHYPSGVAEVRAVEPSEVAWRLAGARLRRSQVPVRRSGLDGQRLDMPDSSMDDALSTFTLCTIPDVRAALAEIVRVLRPGGTFHFLEHGLSPERSVARWQHRLDPIQRRVAGGCHLSRPVADLVAGSGLELLEVENDYLPGPTFSKPYTYLYRGQARRPG